MSNATTERPVRITIEGTAHQVGTHGLRVKYGNGTQPAGAFLLLDAGGVTVEDVTPAHAWTDGDVVAVDGTQVPYVARRADGKWHTTNHGGHLEDHHVDLAVRKLGAEVLRYQAGDQ